MIGKAALALALTGAVIAATLPRPADADAGRVRAMKGRCLTSAQILAKLRRDGYAPLGRLQRRGGAYEIQVRRRGKAATAVLNGCTGRIVKLIKPNKAVLAAPGLCVSKASIVSKFDKLGYYHIQVSGPMTLVPAPAGYTGKVYAVRAWTKAPPQCPWDFAVKCTNGEILTQKPDFC